jgi:hypothetical protein
LTLPRPLTAQQLRATHDDVRQQIDALLDADTDEGHLKACICNDHGQWLYWPPEPIPSPANHSSPTSADHIVTSAAGGAV